MQIQSNFYYTLKKHYHSLLFVLLGALFFSVSCQVKPYVTMPEYEEFIIGKSLMILPLQSSHLQLPAEVKKAFGENVADSVYISFFEDNFYDVLPRISSFSKVTSIKLKPVALRAMEVIVPANDTTYFYLPNDKKILLSEKDEPSDFILFLSGLQITHSWIDIEYAQKPNIRHTIYYLFWDNQRHKIVCYGKTSNNSGISNKNKQSFQLMINNLAKSLIENTPFRKILNQW